MPSSVLGELNEAFRRAKGRDPRGNELLDFDLPFDEQLYHEYRARFAGLQGAYDGLVRRSDEQPTLKALSDELAAFWKFVLAQRYGLRLFQLLRWWRQDRVGTAPGSTRPSSPSDDVGYLLIAIRLLVYALGAKSYEDNIRVKSFTEKEWSFIRAPLVSAMYYATYDNVLKNALKDVDGSVHQAELFLRLLAFGRRHDAWLATEQELDHILKRLLVANRAELTARSFVSQRAVARPRQTTFRIGETVGNMVYIVYFEGALPAQIYVNFAETGGVIYSVPRGKFVDFAEQAEYYLLYEETRGLLVLLPLLFEVMAAVPGVVAGGFAGLVEALLYPVEGEVAGKVMDAIGLDPDQSGWVVLGINVLTHHLAGSLRASEPPVAPDLQHVERRFTRGIENAGTDESRAAAVAARAVEAPGTKTPALAARTTGPGGSTALVETADAQTELTASTRPSKGIGWRETDEIRAEPVSSRPAGPGRPARRAESAAEAEEADEAGKGSRKTSDTATREPDRGTATRSTPEGEPGEVDVPVESQVRNKPAAERWLRRVRNRIRDPNHPLHFLLEPRRESKRGVLDWRKTRRVTRSGRVQYGRYPGNEEGPTIQIGHQGAFASGAEEQFMIEDSDWNIDRGGSVIESKRAYSFKDAVVIDGVAVDVASAQQWERLGLLPAGTVERAPIISPPRR